MFSSRCLHHSYQTSHSTQCCYSVKSSSICILWVNQFNTNRVVKIGNTSTKHRYQYFIYSVLRHWVYFFVRIEISISGITWSFTAKRSIHNLLFPKNIDLNHKSMHDSVYLTNLIILDIVFVILYHTHREIDIVRYVMVWWKFKSNTKVLIIIEKVFWNRQKRGAETPLILRVLLLLAIWTVIFYCRKLSCWVINPP